MTAFTISIDEATLTALDDLAARTASSRDALVHQALESYLELQAWQLKEIEAGVADADAGNFASDEEVAAVFAKHGVAYGAGR